MSANQGPLASTKGESTSSKPTKSGYDHLDINKLYKGKSTEPVAKTVTQKHGMQTLGKAPPARRPGNLTAVKSDSTSNDVSSSPSVPQTPSSAAGQGQPHPPPGWANTLPHPPGPPSPHNVPNVPTTGQQQHPHVEKNWSGPERGGNFPSQRFAQEFPTLAGAAGGEPSKGPPTNSSGPPMAASGPQPVLKPHDNQYGPGPILRPQTEGSWIQGGGRNMTRPPGPVPPSNVPNREFGPGPERSNLGGPTPPPMSLGQGGPAPPPLGAYPMNFRGGMVPPQAYMYPNSGPPGPGGFYPPGGPGMPRYGMPIPPGAPPPRGNHPIDNSRDSGRNNRAQHQQIQRPGSHFTANPIIKQEDLERMDEIGTHDGGWASTHDDVDYNKKISFEDEEEERREGQGAFKGPPLPPASRGSEEEPVRRHVNAKVIERQPSISERDREPRFDNREREHPFVEHAENDEDWKRARNNNPYETKDRGDRGNRRRPDDDWRSGNNRYDDDRNKKVAPTIIGRQDVRAAPDFSNKYNNIAPRFLRQQQQGGQPPVNYPQQQPTNQRQTPSPVSTNPPGKERDNRDFRDLDWERREPNRDRPPSRDMNFKILERRRVDSETSREANREGRDKRFGGTTEYDSNIRNDRFPEKDQNKNSRFATSEFQRERSKESDDNKTSSNVTTTGTKGAEPERSEQPAESKESRKLDDSKASFRGKQEFTSWADEVDDDEFNREAEDNAIRKSAKDLSIQPKREFSNKQDDRGRGEVGHRRIYIQQRMVEDMRTPKPDSQPELKQAIEPIKQDKPVDKSKPASVWGERERLKQENETVSQQKENEDKSSSSEKELRKSAEKEVLPQKAEIQQKHGEHSPSGSEKAEKKVSSFQEKDPKERERRDSRDKNERPEQKPFERQQMSKQDARFDRGGSDHPMERERDRERHDRTMDRNRRDRHDDRGYDRLSEWDRGTRGGVWADSRPGARGGGRGSKSGRGSSSSSYYDRPSNKRSDLDKDRDEKEQKGNDEKSSSSEKELRKSAEKEVLPQKAEIQQKHGEHSPSGSEKAEKKVSSFQEKDPKERERRDSRDKNERPEQKPFDRQQMSKQDSRFDRGSDHQMDRERHDRTTDRNRIDRHDERGYDRLSDRERGTRGGVGADSRAGARGAGRGSKSGRGSSSSSYYDRPSNKRSDQDKDREEKEFERNKEDVPSEPEITKDKKLEKLDSQDNGKKEGSVEESTNRSKKEKEPSSGDPTKKVSKSPSTSKRNIRGGSRLQGYGPPSDKIPFSSSASNKDEESGTDKMSDHQSNKSSMSQPPQNSGPIPLMELGEISPPNMPPRSRHGYQAGGRGNRNPVPPRLQREEPYPYKGTGNGKRAERGRNNDMAKPLMSLNSNEIERGGEWETESESDDDSKKNGQGGAGSNKTKKERSKGAVSEKYRQSQSQNQNLSRNSGKQSLSGSGCTNADQNNSSNNQNTANNNSRGGGKTSGMPPSGRTGSVAETDSFSGVIALDSHETPDNSENVDGDSGGFQEVRNKKSFATKEKTFPASKTVRTAAAAAEKSAVKGRPVKNPPYEARPNQSKDIPPRFLARAQHHQPIPGKTAEGNGSFPKDTNVAHQGSAWEKPITPNSRTEQGSHQSMSQSASIENKDSVDLKLANNANSAMTHNVGPKPVTSLLDGTNPPVKTMIFENTNLKSGGKFTDVSKTSVPTKISDMKKDGAISSSLELGKELPLNFGKVAGENSPELDFSSSPFDDPSNSNQSAPSQQQMTSHAPAKPMSISQTSRPSYVSHQASPISPCAADLSEKIQSVKRVWDPPSIMPSVAEQTSVCGTEENSFHAGFGAESFKGNDSSNRDFGQSLQQTSSGYAPGNSPALSAIAKPDSSSSPSTTTIRQVNQGKAQQSSGMESQQSHASMSSPFSGYAMQHQGGSTFGGIPAVPSPPTVMYGASQPHLHGGSGVYQAFPHVDGSQVGSQQFRQYANAQAAAANAASYGLGGSLFLTSIDSTYQPHSSYQHQQGSQGGPGPGQAPNQSNRISPGPLTTSGGGNAGGVMINSTSNSMMGGIKSQGSSGNHPNLSHQVHPAAQQAYSQMSHHPHPAAMGHPSHHMGAVGPSKGGYSQGGISAQSQPQLFIPFDLNQPSVINLSQNYLSSGIRSGPPGGPPPSATPPALQASSSYYSGSSGNQGAVYPSGSSQGGNLQQLHVAVAPNPQALQNLQNATQHFGLQFQSPLNIPGYNSQTAAATVSALNLGNPLVRPGGHSHSYMKQGLDMVPTNQLKSSHDSLMNPPPSWNTSAFNINQSFHGGGNKTGNISDRNNVNTMNSQRKSNNHMPNMSPMNKYSNPGYPGQQKGGRFSAPGPIQRPISTSPSTGPGGVPSSSHSLPASEST